MKAARGFARVWIVTLLLSVTMAGCGSDAEETTEAATPTPEVEPTPTASPAAGLLRLRAVRGEDPAIEDEQGRQVLLRGVNLSSLGDYFQGNPELPTVMPLREDEFARIASHGFNSIRLLMSWSRLEPEPDVYDRAYVEEIRDVVRRAAAEGIYSVLDMHQDAWSKYVATPPEVNCGSRESSIGWDGAPDWATITDGRTTCRSRGQGRELAPAVMRAFDNFYADRDGIQGHLVRLWAFLAREFANEPAVAGYDLLNEPNFGSDILNPGPKLAAFTTRAVEAIRAAEAEAGGGSHIIFFEPVVTWPVDLAAAFSEEFTDDTNIVFAPHIYSESINTELNTLTLEESFARSAAAAARYGSTFWVGEYGWFWAPAEQKERVIRFGREEDRWRVGSSWWQWRQACGDPHSIGRIGGSPDPVLIHFHATGCPGDVDLGPVPEWKTVLSRPYPRAAPGRLRQLESDGDARTLRLRGEADGEGELDLWVPEEGEPVVTGTGLGAVQVAPVPGGYRVRVATEEDYTVEVR